MSESPQIVPAEKSGRWRALATKVTSLKDSPAALAKGVACAIFAALTPFFGIKIFIALGLARLIKANLVATTMSYLSCNLIVPFLPFIMTFQYGLGYLLLHGASKSPFHEIKGAFDWHMLVLLGCPLILGSLLTAALTALLTYFMIYRIIHLAAKTKKHETPHPLPAYFDRTLRLFDHADTCPPTAPGRRFPFPHVV